MILETRHLAHYLPYKLQCKVIDRGIEKTATLNGVFDDGSCVFANIVESEQGFESVKPILRPMRDIEHYFEKIYGSLEHQDVTDYLDADFLLEKGVHIDEIQLLKPEELPNGVIKVLSKHQFDVFGLIEKGLAININEL